MRFLKSKAAVIFMIVMTALCLVAVGITVRITITMIEKRDKVIRPEPVGQQEPVVNNIKSININKLKDQSFYFNGEKISGLDAFVGVKEDFFVPIDRILDELYIKYSYYSSDDIIQFKINDKKVLIRIGMNKFTVGNKEFNLDTPPFAAKNHFLVPVGLLACLDGFETHTYGVNNTVFVNHFPGYSDNAQNIRLLKLVGGTAGVTGIDSDKSYWVRRNNYGKSENIDISDGGWNFMVKSENKVYLLNGKSYTSPGAVNVPASATWSEDGKYLYWADPIKKTSYIYDIGSALTKNLGDYSSRIESYNQDGHLLYGGDILYDYKQGTWYKRVVLTNSAHEGTYTFIERRGKEVLKGNLDYSPDKANVLYFKRDKGYYVSNSDGTKPVLVGNGIDARWVNNNKIFIRNAKNENYVVTKDGKTRTRVDNEWYMVGQTPGGDVFFTEGDMLVCESGGKEKLIMYLPWKCDYVYSTAASGPYVLVSEGVDGVFYADGSNITKLGAYSSLMRDMSKESSYVKDYRGIGSSPDGKTITVLMTEEGFATLYTFNRTQGIQKKIVLDRVMDDRAREDILNLRWISDSSLVLYSSQRGWLIDLKGSLKVHEWVERPDTSIRGILKAKLILG